jgi:hypothetical protein
MAGHIEEVDTNIKGPKDMLSGLKFYHAIWPTKFHLPTCTGRIYTP